MRYLRLFAAFVRFSFSRALEFRLDFTFRIVMDIVFYGVQLGFFTVLYQHTDVIGGWNLDQIYIFVTGIFVCDALYMTLFSNNQWWLPISINNGDLDYHLVRPVSPLFLLSLRDFAANSFFNLIIACGLAVWAVARFPGPFPVGSAIIWAVYLVFGTLVLYLIRLLFIIPVFWLHSNRGLDEVAWALTRLSRRPHQIYQLLLRRVLVALIPLAFVGSIPAHVFFSGLDPLTALHTVAVAVGFSAVVLVLWRLGLRAYSSASS